MNQSHDCEPGCLCCAQVLIGDIDHVARLERVEIDRLLDRNVDGVFVIAWHIPL
jgi:hypothetical protein